jgi:hypothetical protein
LEKSASQLNADTLECFERCRALVKNLWNFQKKETINPIFFSFSFCSKIKTKF